MPKPGMHIRAFRNEDLPAALALTQAVGWSHRLDDWELHARVGRGYVATDDEGRLLGTTIWWPWGEQFGCVGLVVVDPQAQGRGIGRALMGVALADAGPRSLQLVATEVGIKLYQQCGFEPVGGIEQHQGTVVALPAAPLPPDTMLRAIDPSDFNILCSLDRTATGADRSALLRELLRRGGGTLAESEGRPVSYALHRPAGAGTTVGPVVATGTSMALALLARELSGIEGTARVDVPATRTRVIGWLEHAGLPCADHVQRMVRGTPPPQSSGTHVFGLASQALG
jgi:GNAT superfamily N-acetyltransferase